MGQLVGSFIQLTVGQLLLLKDHGDGFRGTGDSFFKQLMNTLGA
jgi:hypothetical protein